MAALIYLVAAAVALTIYVWRPWRGSRPPGTLQLPGPKGWPVIGSLLDLPPKHPWLKFHDYITSYGPIVQLNIMGQSHILLGSETAVDALVRNRSAHYASRPSSPAASLLTQDLNVLLMPHGPEFRSRRRLLAQLISKSAATAEPYQWLETFRAIRDIVRAPEDYGAIFNHWATAMGSRMLYGRSMPDRDGEQLEVMDVITTVEQTVQPGAYLVDVLPWLRYVPDVIAPWKRYLKSQSRRDEDFFYKMWNAAKDDLDNGRDVPSWARMCIEDLRREGRKNDLEEKEIVHTVGVTYTAFGTSSHNMNIFLFAMTRHPEWWARLTAEMDAATGAGDQARLPTLADIPNLPILRAVLLETTRVWPVTPGGVPHRLTKDDVYAGYALPANSIVHLVTWSCGREPTLYPDPDSFNPNRWLDPEFPTYKEPLTEFPTLTNTLMFGAGRRQCPGMQVGTANVYIQAMMLVWACDVSRSKGADGKEILPPFYDFVSGFNVVPEKFDFQLKSRGEKRMKTVEEQYEEALRADIMKA